MKKRFDKNSFKKKKQENGEEVIMEETNEFSMFFNEVLKKLPKRQQR